MHPCSLTSLPLIHARRVKTLMVADVEGPLWKEASLIEKTTTELILAC